MPALNFKKQFAPLVEAGKKRQTIRRLRADGKDPRRGQQLYMYTGMRTKSCRKIYEAECMVSVPIIISREAVVVAGLLLSSRGIADLARDDGFLSVDDFYSFFVSKHAPEFEGRLLKW